MYQQISKQVLKMMETAYKFNECNENMIFELEEGEASCQVTKIKRDGNCLFRALAHQLFGETQSIRKQDQSMKRLRADVVAHIKENYADFEHELKGCVMDRKENVDVNSLDMECQLYLNHCLTKAGCWGGAESIKAVSRIYKVNVVIINENGPCYLVNGFNPNHERTVLLGYRLAHPESKSQGNRNHYDSVINVQQDYIFKCMKSMMSVIVKQFFGDERENVILED